MRRCARAVVAGAYASILIPLPLQGMFAVRDWPNNTIYWFGFATLTWLIPISALLFGFLLSPSKRVKMWPAAICGFVGTLLASIWIDASPFFDILWPIVSVLLVVKSARLINDRPG